MFLKELFEKVNFEKKSADDNKSMKNKIAGKELNRTGPEVIKLFTYSTWLSIKFQLNTDK